MPIVRTSLWSKRCACRLLPATRNVIVVSGTADADRALLQAAQAHFADEKDIDFTYWTGIPVDLLCTQASQVPAGSIIQDHWAYITAGAMAIVLQSLLIVALLINRGKRLRAEQARSKSQQEARRLAGRLLTAQEDERKWLAREMHDDVSQRLAATAIEAGRVEQQLAAADPSRAALTNLKEHLIALSDDVHRISRQLHPAILDDLGLADAIRSKCDRLADDEGMVIDFRCGCLPANLPKHLALCLYRIAQEALRNVAKHAQTKRVGLILNADMEFLYLEIRDFGCGFDPAVARSQPGLGLVSMEERIRLVGGEIAISSTPGKGTSIEVRVPLAEEDPVT